MSSIRDKIAASPLAVERVHVDRWDVDLDVHELTTEQVLAIREAAGEDEVRATFSLLVASVYDPDNFRRVLLVDSGP